MNAHDIDRGAPPQTHGNGRRRSSTRPWGAAPTAHGSGGQPTPHALAQRAGAGRVWPGGGGRSGMTWGQPPRRRGIRAPRSRGSGDRGSPPCRQRPRLGGGRPLVARGGEGGGGPGPAIWWLPPLCQASPAPSLGRAAKFWGQCSLHCPPCPKIRKNHRGSITFFLQLQIQNIFFSLKGITLAHLPLKSQHFVHVFDAVRAYPNSPKTHLRTLVL
jgi:hypothetical protein